MADMPLAPEEFDLLAAELALGVLEGELLTQALRLQMADADFREAVTGWQARLEPLLDFYPEAEAPDLWPAIELRLPVTDAAPGAGNVRAIETRLRAWRVGTLAAGALAAGLATLLLVRPATVAPPRPTSELAQAVSPAVARLGESDGAAQLIANYDAASGDLRIRALKMPQSDLSPELWVIPADNVPRSLGLVAASGSTRIAVSPALRALLQDGVTLAVTMERRDGAPHAAPSTSPVAVGQIIKI